MERYAKTPWPCCSEMIHNVGSSNNSAYALGIMAWIKSRRFQEEIMRAVGASVRIQHMPNSRVSVGPHTTVLGMDCESKIEADMPGLYTEPRQPCVRWAFRGAGNAYRLYQRSGLGSRDWRRVEERVAC